MIIIPVHIRISKNPCTSPSDRLWLLTVKHKRVDAAQAEIATKTLNQGLRYMVLEKHARNYVSNSPPLQYCFISCPCKTGRRKQTLCRLKSEMVCSILARNQRVGKNGDVTGPNSKQTK